MNSPPGIEPVAPTHPFVASRALALGIGYGLLALLAQWFGSSAYLSVPLWPAAGLALACLVVWGWRYWPALWLGAFAAQLIASVWLSGIPLTLIDLVVAALTAGGISLQALLGAALSQRFLRGTAPLAEARHAFAFLLLGGPLACLVSASVSVGLLPLILNLPPEALQADWPTFWAGDTFGVLLVAPLMLLVLQPSRQHWRGHALTIAAPLLLLATLLSAGYGRLVHTDQIEHDVQIAIHADDLKSKLANVLIQRHELLRSIEGLFEINPRPSLTTFSRFHRKALAHAGVDLIEWVPRVSQSERPLLNAWARRDGLPGMALLEADATQRLVAAAVRPDYYPLWFISGSGEHRTIGFDLGAYAPHRQAMQRAAQTTRPALSQGRIDRSARSDNWRLLVPIYRLGFDADQANEAARQVALRGFAVAVLHPPSMWADPIAHTVQDGLGIRIRAMSPWNTGSTPLVDVNVPAPRQSQPDWNARIDGLAGDGLLLELWSLQPWQPGHALHIQILFGIGMMLMLLTGVFVFAEAGNQRRMMHEITIRTLSEDRLSSLLLTLQNRDQAIRQLNSDLEQRVQQSEFRWKFAIEGSGDGLWDWNLTDNTVFFSRRLKEMLGYSEDEISNKLEEWVSRIHPEDKAATLATVQAYLDGTTEAYVSEHRLRCKDGCWIWILDRGVLVSRSADGKPLRMIGTHSDITERKNNDTTLREQSEDIQRKNLQLEAANRAKSEFLSTMSHEIRTPMNGVIGMIDVLQQTSLLGYQVEIVDTIRESAYALLGIVEDILDFSKIESGKLEIESLPMSVAVVVEKACSMLDHLARKQQVELTLFTDPAIPTWVLGDAARLRQVIINLVHNAIKFCHGTERSGRVSVRAVLAGAAAATDEVQIDIAVTDNGIGMDKAMCDRLFTAFTQADASTTRRFGGTGLGLAICGNLVAMMGGSITVTSVPGAGSVFCVHLSLRPVAAEVGASVAKAVAPLVDLSWPESTGKSAEALLSPPRAQALAQRQLVLLAEDNATNQKVTVQQLALLGFAADVSSNGQEALALWRSGDYALLLTDLHMPKMDGYELATAIRADEQGSNRRIPIVALTANAIKGEAERCKDIGMDDYLCKPTPTAELKVMLAKWLPAQPAPPSPSQPLAIESALDVSILAALVGDNPATIADFLQDFQASATTIAAELEAAWADANAAHASALAHKLKASARSVGALTLGMLCEEIEAAGKTGSIELMALLLPRFKAEIAAVNCLINQKCALYPRRKPP